MKTLLHACCAPCSIECVNTLRNEGIEPTLYWYNPNIHPFTEYRSRKETLVAYAESNALQYVLRDEYGLRPFLAAVTPTLDNRCARCYEMRLEGTARYAAENGYEQFSTTLLISPYQNHELLRETGENMAKKYGIAFLYRDFRPHFRDGQQKAREFGLYMQKYCGCIFSEEERYQKKKK